MVSYTCTFSEPLLYDGTLPSNAGQQWQFHKETCVYNSSMYAPTTTITDSSDIQLYASFTAGEVLVALFMFVMIVIELTKMLARSLDRVKTKKKFLGYSNSEVEVKDVL